MVATAKRQLLKVFSGPHLGAEVLLDDGECVIGSDDSCDVIFGDQFIAPRHARLTLRNGSIECAALDGAKVFVAGRQVDAAPLEPFEYFTLGNTHLALGPADAAWPTIDFPEFKLEARVATEDADAPEAADEPESEPTAEASVDEPAVEPANEDPTDRPNGRRVAIGALLLLFCLLPLFLLVLAATSGGATPAAAPDDAIVRAALEKVIQRHNHKQSVEVVERRGKIAVEGYVPTADDRATLNDALGAVLSENYGRVQRSRLRVWDTEGLVTAVGEVARMYDLPVAAEAGGPGEVVLTGEVASAEAKAKLVAKVTEDVPRIGRLTDKMTLEGQKGSPSKPANPSKMAAKDAEEALPQPKPKRPKPKQMAKKAPAPPTLPPIRSISIGNTRSITLGNGQRVYRGAILESGYTVSQIDADRVVLVRNGKQQIVKIGI